MTSSLASVLPDYVKKRHLEHQWQAFCVLRCFSETVDEICQSPLKEAIKPITLNGKAITVFCSSASAIQELMLYKEQILQRLNSKLQEGDLKNFPSIEQIYYQITGV